MSMGMFHKGWCLLGGKMYGMRFFLGKVILKKILKEVVDSEISIEESVPMLDNKTLADR